jgi:hypothetical protein
MMRVLGSRWTTLALGTAILVVIVVFVLGFVVVRL